MGLDHDHYMALAIEDCRSGFAGADGGPFGACIVKGGEVLALGHNTVLRDTDPTAHAEMNALRRAAAKLGSWDLSGCEIYSTTEPCPMCFSAIHWARIGTIYMGTRIEDVAALGFSEIALSNEFLKARANLDVTLETGIAAEACRQLLKDWQDQPDATTY